METIDVGIEDQKNLFNHIERMANTFNSKPKGAISKGYVQTMFEDLELNFKTFKDGHDQIIEIIRESSINTADVPYISTDVYYKCYDTYISFKTILLDLLFEFESPQTPTVHASTFAASSSRNETFIAGARLPKINLPIFSGKYLEWISYRDMFLSLVHNNNSLSKVQKFYYLKGSCTETPLSMINEYPAQDSSYDLAWSALEKRFHNERKLVEQILKRLFAIPTSNGSFNSVKELLDTTRNCVAQLKALNVNISIGDAVLVHMTTQKLDLQTRKEWEQSLNASTTIPELTTMLSFLETTFRTLESIEGENKSYANFGGNNSTLVKDNRKKPTRTIRVHNATFNQDDNCPCCNKRHPLYKCFRFSALSSSEKTNLINQKRLCRNCLNTGHLQSSCKLNARCQFCREPHHTIIHNEFTSSHQIQPASPNTPPQNTSTNSQLSASALTSTPHTKTVSTNISCHNANQFTPALLPTAKVVIKTPTSTFNVKTLVDQGSQMSFISEELSQLLSVPKYRTHVDVSGIGGNSAFTAKKYLHVTIFSNYDTEFELCLLALIVPSVTSYAPNKHNHRSLPNLSQFYLADPKFMVPEKIDLLLGNDIYGDLLLQGMVKYESSIFLQETRLGWIVSGRLGPPVGNPGISINICSLDEQLRLFWEQEELFDGKPQVNEETLCEKLFSESHYRDKSGRYTVYLPFKRLLQGQELPKFTHTDYNALKRLKQLESSFKTKPIFALEYKKFMTEYESLQHMVKLGEYPQAIPDNAYFFPHHGVLRESSTTTKLRVVFDGGSRRPPQTSINEELSAGPALQNDLPTIITRWRRYNIGFTADLEKMFRQIQVCEEHQNFQCILWRDEQTNKICVYNLRTVTYGTTSAPYLAIRVLQQLSTDEENNYPQACATLRSDTYVDDVISGADTLDEALHLQNQLCSLLKSGCFRLRKWNSNSSQLIKNIPEEDRDKNDSFHIHQPKMSKALGLSWDTSNDSFCFSINFTFSNPVTKRSLLSDAAKLFDPLGWLAPTTILAKIMFQKLWKINLDWNDELSEELQDEWIKFRNELKVLEEIRLPRWIGYKPAISMDIHAFSDASQIAYAAVVYSRITTESGEIFINLLQSKTKVAPLKQETIPRLELCAATLLAKLVSKIKNNVEFNIRHIVYWTDSTIVLAWLKNQSTKLEVYVANRVSQIKNLSDVNDWRYVPSGDNPADCASRGLMPNDLVNHAIWWQGPCWLKSSSDTWPTSPTKVYNQSKASSVNLTSISTTNGTSNGTSNKPSYHKTIDTTTQLVIADIIKKYSSLTAMIRATSYILRYFFNLKQKMHNNERESGFLKTYELNRAMNKLIKFTQNETFHLEITCLKFGKPLPNQSKIGQLAPFLDEMEILRVGGRLFNAKLPFKIKHPILLTKQNPLSILIFSDAHLKTLHGGIQFMQSYVLRRYWIPSGRDLAKKVQRECVVCFKYRAKTCQQLMGNLPAVRLQPVRAFKHSGLDYAGPISIKQSTLRSSTTSKGYICLFVCMCTKAIHLEAVTSLNVDAFLAAFRRFTARRGMCTDLYSDCGTNFVGANKELQIIYQRNKASLPDYLVETLANQGTKWHFIPPASPHFGGLWEAGVKSSKHHLRRIMKDRNLTYEELSTLLTQIESCLNSRPLCPISTDPADNNALTPAHFLIGEPTTCIPDEDLLDVNIDRLSRWKLVERMKQHFWDRWNREYMCRLQARPKWNKIKRNVKEGDLVILLHEKCSPGQWPLAKVEELHPGSDGLVRVVTIFCNGKRIKRPISKICLLPINDSTPAPQHNDTF